MQHSTTHQSNMELAVCKLCSDLDPPKAVKAVSRSRRTVCAIAISTHTAGQPCRNCSLRANFELRGGVGGSEYGPGWINREVDPRC